MNKYKNALNTEMEKIKMDFNKNDETKNTMSILENEIKNDLESNRNFIENLGGKILDKENCFNFVNVKNPEDNFIQIISMEASVEDMYIIVKRAFEKGVINFNETMKFIRSLSKEAVKIKFIRDKILKKYDKSF